MAELTDVVVEADRFEQSGVGVAPLVRELRTRGFFGSTRERVGLIIELVEALSDGVHSPSHSFDGPFTRRLSLDCVLYERDEGERNDG